MINGRQILRRLFLALGNIVSLQSYQYSQPESVSKVFLSPHLHPFSEINLSENRLGERGAEALCRMLLENTTLVSLSLSANELNDNAAKHLSLAITTNQRLERLDLSHNKLGDAAGRMMLLLLLLFFIIIIFNMMMMLLLYVIIIQLLLYWPMSS